MSTSGMKTGQATAEARRAILRIQADVLACVCGLLGGVGLCMMTVWLVLKGGPHVGAHLQLLGQYFRDCSKDTGLFSSCPRLM